MKQRRFTKAYHTHGTVVVIRVASKNAIKYYWHMMRGYFARKRGASYEYNGIERW